MKCVKSLITATAVLALSSLTALAQTEEEAQQTEESLRIHVFGGASGAPRMEFETAGVEYPVVGKRGHVLQYDPVSHIPLWVAYRIEPSFRETPPRKGRFKSFRKDDHSLVVEAEAALGGKPIADDDYNGLFGDFNLARGHLAPFAVMGGDRDGDGRFAHPDPSESDPFDEQTIFDANMMTNIAPQYHDSFNGSPGLWWCLERWLQDCAVTTEERSVHVIAGPILGIGPAWTVGPAEVRIPEMFFKIIVFSDVDSPAPPTLAFLFPHQRQAHGQIEDYLVTIDMIEGLSGFDFFPQLENDVDPNAAGAELGEAFEDTSTYQTWLELWEDFSRRDDCNPRDAQWRPDRVSAFD